MKFIKLEILNLASLDRQEGETINFEEGALGESTIFSIVGPTGSGKSTILDAICLALYNRAPRYPRKKGDRNQNIEIFGELDEGEKNRLAPTDSRNILTRGKKEGYSKLTFLANNGMVYRAEWYVKFQRVKYDNAVTSLYRLTTENGQPKEEMADWEDLPQIVGLDYEQFLRTVLIAQGSFANFLTAKENERYELLEKLIGCEELYSSIAARIKQQKDDAVEAYNQIAANFSAQEKDIIPEEELTALKERINQLEAEEKKAKAELSKVTEALAWYATEEKHTQNLAKYEEAFKSAERNINDVKEQVERLALHDATLDAVSLYKDIKTAEHNIAQHGKTLKDLQESISKKETQIKDEGENLIRLKVAAQSAADTLEQQKHHINKAREIKAELEAARKTAAEKKTAVDKAIEAKTKADKDVTDNTTAIAKSATALQQAKDVQEALDKDIEAGSKLVKDRLAQATSTFNSENQKLEACDATKLQDAKAQAEKAQADLKTAIRIQDDVKSKQALKKENLDRQTELSKRNTEIEREQKTIDVDALTREVETLSKSYTLMTSENWEQHRNELVEGEPCPLCGATHHPYHAAEVVVPVINDMKELVDDKKSQLNTQTKKKEDLSKEHSKNVGALDGIKQTLDNLERDFSALSAEWQLVHKAHNDWPEDADVLRSIKADVDMKAANASQALKDYNTLAKQVDSLRKAKESAEKAEREYADQSAKQKQEAEKKVTDANTALATEKGKTENLQLQQTEKTEALRLAEEVKKDADTLVAHKLDALKAEIGDKNPDTFEQALTQAKDDAAKAVTDKEKAIGNLREEQKGLQGKEQSAKEQIQEENAKRDNATEAFTKWLNNYNKEGKSLSADDIAMLYTATDNWEAMRANQKRLSDALTSASTTLKNETKAHEEHQVKKPDQAKEDVNARKTELESITNEELVNAKARLLRHETAKLQMGNMFDQKQSAEQQKVEWEQIADAIGGDGKTLRKIAQCYTLRFLIEHANVEIRKFNSRYELQQVKNSLGIRVIDHDRADDVRDTTSLSGGETFIVSLGLALGLSALSSRNISFENLFIDEGFGTLDPDTLATVIDSLAMLQSSQGKKVGVISHTDTMSERITTQIRIIKNGNSGSSHIEIYP